MYVERGITSRFEKIKNVYPVVAIVGARQAGKTTFLKEKMKTLNAAYLLFDDPDVRELFEEDIKKFEIQNIKGYDVSVLDEVQYCTDAGRKLKYLADTGEKIWITSSSEIILGKEVLSYLVGRVSILKLYPLSLAEFLVTKKHGKMTEKMRMRDIWEHITYGGYPKVAITEGVEIKKIILRDLYETMIMKDIARTFSIDDINSLEEFVRYLSHNIGNIISYDKVIKKISLSFQTLKKYIDAMEKSYLILKVSPFYTNKLKEIVKQPKIYFLDTGLRNSISKSFESEPDGKLFENYVATEIVKSGFSPKYWRTKTKAEVDFIVENENDIIPIEVKMQAYTEKIEKSLRSFISAYKPKRALVVSYKKATGVRKIGGCEVIFTNVTGMNKLLKERS